MMTELIKPLMLARDGRVSAHGFDFTAIDVKATGLREGRIVELGVVRVQSDGTVAGSLATLVNPGQTLPVGATGPHGITRDDLVGAPSFADVLGPLLDLCRGAVIAAHDLALTQGFLALELARLNVRLPVLPGVSTMTSAQPVIRLPNYRLGTIARALGTADYPTHLASVSARVCAQVVIALASTHGLRFAEPPRFPELPHFAPGDRIRRRPETELAESGWMSEAVDRVFAEPPGTDRTATQAYLDLLADAVRDQHLSGEELWALAALAADAGMSESDIARIHHGLVSALQAVAEADGVVTADEYRELCQVAAALGLPEAIAGIRPAPAGRRAIRVLVLGSTAKADQLRARVLAEGAQLAKKLTATVTHVVYDSSVAGEEPRLARATELGAQVIEAGVAPVALGFDQPAPRQVPPTRVFEPAPTLPARLVGQLPAPAESQPIRPLAPVKPHVAPAARSTRPVATVAGRLLMGLGVLLMLVTVIAMFGGDSLAGGIVVAILGVGLLLGGWYLTEAGGGRGGVGGGAGLGDGL